MARNDGRLVKNARARLELAEDVARGGGTGEEQLKYDSAVRAASDFLTDAQTSEHLHLVRARLHAIREKVKVEDAD
ncbi:MAG TPA: hypothetical protein VM510_11655 [Caulifigura sp.]|nr:hypothetical protein [Caulifigura sp.]